MTSVPVLRFAPSPNGPLHLGHALSALTGFDLARRLGRALPGAHRGHRRRPLPRGVRRRHLRGSRLARRRLGGAGAASVAALSPPTSGRQSGSRRRAALPVLCLAQRDRGGGHARRLDPDGAPLYPGLHKRLPRDEIEMRLEGGERFALRIDMEQALAAARQAPRRGAADVHRARRRRPGAGLAGAARSVGRRGDPAQGRAGELSPRRRRRRCAPGHHPRHARPRSVPGDRLHRLLQVLLGLPEPTYRHHRLLTDADGRKLSKSGGDTGLAALRAGGATPADIRRHARPRAVTPVPLVLSNQRRSLSG